jgi:hypothetical protein
MNHVIPANEQQIDIDVQNLLGEWRNVNSRVDFISRLSISSPGEGKIRLHLYDACGRHGREFAQSTALAYTAPNDRVAAGFHCRLDHDGATTSIAANEKLGILVLQCYTEFAPDDARQNILTREFYWREPSTGFSEPYGNADRHREQLLLNNPRREDFAFLRSHWHNTYADSKWVVDLQIIEQKGAWHSVMQRHGQAQTEQPLALKPFVFDAQEVGFSYSFRDQKIDSHYAAYSNKGLVVLSGFHSLTADGAAQRVMSREFYYDSR